MFDGVGDAGAGGVAEKGFADGEGRIEEVGRHAKVFYIAETDVFSGVDDLICDGAAGDGVASEERTEVNDWELRHERFLVEIEVKIYYKR